MATNEPALQITAAILAGGLGTRLRSVVTHVPKVLAPVAGRPFLLQLIEQLACADFLSVLLLTGYQAEVVRKTMAKSHCGLMLRYCQEKQPLGTGGALRNGLGMLDAPRVLLLNGDSYCAVNLREFVAFHDQRQAAVSMVLTHVKETERYGRVEANENSKVMTFREKGESGPGWINAGIYLIERDLIETIPADQSISLERELFPRWIRQPGIHGYRTEGQFIDIGTPESYAIANRHFDLRPSLPASPAAAERPGGRKQELRRV